MLRRTLAILAFVAAALVAAPSIAQTAGDDPMSTPINTGKVPVGGAEGRRPSHAAAGGQPELGVLAQRLRHGRLLGQQEGERDRHHVGGGVKGPLVTAPFRVILVSAG